MSRSKKRSSYFRTWGRSRTRPPIVCSSPSLDGARELELCELIGSDTVHYHYRDIRSRIAEPPKWWDEHGTPRYCDFGPGETSDIYFKECCLLRIRCQDCGAKFDVCMSWNLLDKAMHDAASLSERIENGSIHYGDPPNDRCC